MNPSNSSMFFKMSTLFDIKEFRFNSIFICMKLYDKVTHRYPHVQTCHKVLIVFVPKTSVWRRQVWSRDGEWSTYWDLYRNWINTKSKKSTFYPILSRWSPNDISNFSIINISWILSKIVYRWRDTHTDHDILTWNQLLCIPRKRLRFES